jgi:gas vesicle protein
MTTEQTIKIYEDKLVELHKELGHRIQAVVGQEKYKDLSEYENEIYKTLQGNVSRVESDIKITEGIIDYGRKLLSGDIKRLGEDPNIDYYDEWLGEQGIN